MYKLVFSPAFQRQLKKLLKKNPSLKTKTLKALKLLRKNPNHPSFKLHKLSSQNNWSISLAKNLRLIFHRKEKNIFCLKIGTHDQVY